MRALTLNKDDNFVILEEKLYPALKKFEEKSVSYYSSTSASEESDENFEGKGK